VRFLNRDHVTMHMLSKGHVTMNVLNRGHVTVNGLSGDHVTILGSIELTSGIHALYVYVYVCRCMIE